MNLALEELMRHCAADQRGGDVVEKAREHEHHDEQDETAFPVVREVLGQDDRHMTLFKMPREQRKAHQQTEEIGQNDPFVLEMADQARETGTSLEACEDQLVDRDCCQTGQTDCQSIVMEERDAEQRHGE